MPHERSFARATLTLDDRQVGLVAVDGARLIREIVLQLELDFVDQAIKADSPITGLAYFGVAREDKRVLVGPEEELRLHDLVFVHACMLGRISWLKEGDAN